MLGAGALYCVVRSSQADVAAPQTLALLKTVTIVLGVFTVVHFSSCPQSLPASGSFQMSQLFA